MKFIALFALLTALFAVTAGIKPDPQNDGTWRQYKGAFRKYYGMKEDNDRRLNFEKRFSRIKEHRKEEKLGLSSYTLGLNKYSDLSDEEITKQLMGFKGENNFTSTGTTFPTTTSKSSQTPALVDWRTKGLVTDIKDQGQCGACWAFSATGALEGQMAKKTGTLVSLSEQNLVDCSQSAGNDGCDGGWMNQAFKYIKSNGGIDTEDSYPYIEEEGLCSYTSDGLGATVSSYMNIPTGDERTLMKAVSNIGPVSAAINADGDFSSYQSGIYNPTVCANTLQDLTHGILIVGYGTENGQDYWLVKNSWGDTWGIQGYIKMARNKSNLCGIATKASFPVV